MNWQWVAIVGILCAATVLLFLIAALDTKWKGERDE